MSDKTTLRTLRTQAERDAMIREMAERHIGSGIFGYTGALDATHYAAKIIPPVRSRLRTVTTSTGRKVQYVEGKFTASQSHTGTKYLDVCSAAWGLGDPNSLADFTLLHDLMQNPTDPNEDAMPEEPIAFQVVRNAAEGNDGPKCFNMGGALAVMTYVVALRAYAERAR